MCKCPCQIRYRSIAMYIQNYEKEKEGGGGGREWSQSCVITDRFMRIKALLKEHPLSWTILPLHCSS